MAERAAFGEGDVNAAPVISPVLRGLINRYDAAEHAFNTSLYVEDGPLGAAFFDALIALDAYQPTTPYEFVCSIAARFSDDTVPTEEHVLELIRQAKRLAGEGR